MVPDLKKKQTFQTELEFKSIRRPNFSEISFEENLCLQSQTSVF